MDRDWGHSRSPNRSNYHENESRYRDYRERKGIQLRFPRSSSYKFPSDFQGSSSRRHDYPSSSRDSRSRSRERTFSRSYKRTSSHYRDDVDFNYNHAPERRQMRSHWNNDDHKASPDRDQTQARPYETQEPNRTVMVQGLGAEVTEDQIREAVEKSGFAAMAVRLVKKYTSPRSFAFVEFADIMEATRFMHYQEGLLKLEDNQTVVLRYSIQKFDKEVLEKKAEDWFCMLCGAQNFKRRTECYKCQKPRKTSEYGEGEDEIALGITATIILRKLDTLTTAESVVKALSVAIPDLMNKISAIIIGKDQLTGVSRGVCYLKVESIVDALVVKDALTNRPTPIKIDGKAVLIAYCKYNMGNVQEPYEQAAYTESAKVNQTGDFAGSDVTASAEQLGLDEPNEYQNYMECYRGYYPQQVGASSSQMDQTNAAAAVAQSAIQQRHGSKPKAETRPFSVPTGADGKTYPMPDTSKCTLDVTTGLYFDVTTGLHFDAASGYYWNSTIQKYMYYDTERMTYLLVPEAQPVAQSGKTKNNKGANMSVAKKVMKDMERWEKMLNQKKDKVDSNSSNCTEARSADIGYSVLESRALHKHGFDTPPTSTSNLVPNYSASDSSDEETLDLDESTFLDLTSFICKLCKRQLPSKELLQKHAKLSELHKSNLEQLKASMKTDVAVYRDRAKERRVKHPDRCNYAPRARKIERNLPSVSSDPVGPIGVENVGNRMLQKMGWSDGQGLGRTNQGTTSIVEVGQRKSTAGLGTKMPVLNGNESYKECVKKTFYARFKEMQD